MYMHQLQFARSEIYTGVCSVSHVQLLQVLPEYFRFRRIVLATHDQASRSSSRSTMIEIEELQHLLWLRSSIVAPTRSARTLRLRQPSPLFHQRASKHMSCTRLERFELFPCCFLMCHDVRDSLILCGEVINIREFGIRSIMKLDG